ncbi:MAG: hypothetical protein R3F56_10100 [Planctomycetota bacterium]
MTPIPIRVASYVRSQDNPYLIELDEGESAPALERSRLRAAMADAIGPVALMTFRWQQNELIHDEIVRAWAAVGGGAGLAVAHPDRREPSRWDPELKIWEPLGVGVACVVTDSGSPDPQLANAYLGFELGDRRVREVGFLSAFVDGDGVRDLSVSPTSHSRFWQKLDEMGTDGGLRPYLALFDSIVHVWFHDQDTLEVWRGATRDQRVQASVAVVASAIAEAMRKEYGARPDVDAFLAGCEAMGRELLRDAHGQPRRMDDYRQWFAMCAFADAWRECRHESDFAALFHRGALSGLLNGALHECRFKLGTWVQVRQPDQIGRYAKFVPAEALARETKAITDASRP